MDETTNIDTTTQVPMYSAGIVIGAILLLVMLELVFRGSE